MITNMGLPCRFLFQVRGCIQAFFSLENTVLSCCVNIMRQVGGSKGERFQGRIFEWPDSACNEIGDRSTSQVNLISTSRVLVVATTCNHFIGNQRQKDCKDDYHFFFTFFMLPQIAQKSQKFVQNYETRIIVQFVFSTILGILGLYQLVVIFRASII